MAEMSLFSSNIKFLRHYFGLNQKGLAYMLTERDVRLSLHPSTISAWERGVTDRPNSRTLSLLVRVLNELLPVRLTVDMLIEADLSRLLIHSSQHSDAVADNLDTLSRRIENVEAYFKYCLCRITQLEARMQNTTGSALLSEPEFIDVLKKMGVQYKSGVFRTTEGIDVTDEVHKIMPAHLLTGLDSIGHSGKSAPESNNV